MYSFLDIEKANLKIGVGRSHFAGFVVPLCQDSCRLQLSSDITEFSGLEGAHPVLQCSFWQG